MSQSGNQAPPTSAFSADIMLMKAQRYAEQMREVGTYDWRYALWSSLALELLARAALAKVSPVLVADEKKWTNLLAALGHSPKETKYAPRSISTSEVLKRLGEIFAEFEEVHSFCVIHTGRRNAELHSGESPFEGVSASKWHSQWYRSCQILLATMGLGLSEFFSSEEVNIALTLIAASADEAAKAVLGDISAHKESWATFNDDDRKRARTIVEFWARREDGHRVPCPSCGENALVTGDPCAAAKIKLEGDTIVESQEHLPNKFECVACKLKINGLSRLTVAGLGDRYVKTTKYDAAAYYAPEDEYPDFEEDNNEPF
jgi:hypothetical protein